MTEPMQPLSSVFNFRDFGLYAGEGGRRMRPGRLFRSGHFYAVESDDSATLDALGVVTHVDLRSPTERTQRPNKWRPSSGEVLVYDVERPNFFVTYMESGPVTLANARNYMFESYTRIPYEPGHIEIYRNAFARLSQEGGFIVHCMAGKDRTGIFCALVHHVLGVSLEDIRTDYLLTNTSPSVKERDERLLRFFRTNQNEMPSDEAVQALSGVHEDYLDQAFKTIRARSGSLENYLQTELKVGPAETRTLRDKLLE